MRTARRVLFSGGGDDMIPSFSVGIPGWRCKKRKNARTQFARLLDLYALVSARPRGPSPPAEAGRRAGGWAAHRYRASGCWDLTTVVVRSRRPRIDVTFGPRDTGDAFHVYPKLVDIIVLTVDNVDSKDVHL